MLRQQKVYQQVVAPFDGIVTQRNIDVGSLVQADATSGTFMFALTQSDVMRIRLYVPQDAAIGVKPRVDAVVRVPEIPDHTFPGTVARIANAQDPATRTLMTEIDVPNADGELSPGTYCTVELKIPRRTPSLIVPAGAIVFDRDGLHVLVAENGVARSRKITEIRDLGSIQRAPDGSAAPSFSGIQTPRLQRLRSRLPNEKRLHAPMIAERVCINAGQRFAQAGTTSPRRMMPI